MTFTKIAAAALCASILAAPHAAMALSPSQCNALFNRADRNHDGSLNAYEARPYLSVMAPGPIKPQRVTIITRAHFNHECRKPAFDGFAQ